MPLIRDGASIQLSGAIVASQPSQLDFEYPINYVRVINNNNTPLYIRFNEQIVEDNNVPSIYDAYLGANEDFEIDGLIITSVSLWRSSAINLPHSDICIVGW